MSTQKITTFLTFNNQAEEAVTLYTSLFKDSKIGNVSYYPDSFPGLGGKFMTASFTLNGQTFMALNGGSYFKFAEGISLSVNCENQEEVDRLWNALSEGGEEQQCGWLKDKFGVSWQIIPSVLGELLHGKHGEKSQRAMNAMLQMKKLDIAKLQQAFDGETKAITIETHVKSPIEKVWKCWTEPEHIVNWNHASDDWHTPKAENDLRVGGKFTYTMAAKDGSFSFDFGGVYTEVKQNELIRYTLGDERKVEVIFIQMDDVVKVIETFDPESVNPVEMQRQGWQNILDNFKKYTEQV